MNKYYKKLELDKILDLLAEQTYSDACREKALKLKPSFDEEEIRTELKKTDDAFKLSAKFGTPRVPQNKGSQHVTEALQERLGAVLPGTSRRCGHSARNEYALRLVQPVRKHGKLPR